jgi:hypothetical protein
MATYKEIQNYVKQKHGFQPKTCWIADVKFQCGISMREAPNRQSEERTNPCPENKIDSIKDALKHFNMI